jgi:carbonic anhydrase
VTPMNSVSEENVRLVMQQIRQLSPILRDMLAQGQISLAGGMYDLASGKVQFFER